MLYDEEFQKKVEASVQDSGVLPQWLDDCLYSSDVLNGIITQALVNAPNQAAKFYPHHADRTSYCLLQEDAGAEPLHPPGLPVPPQEMWFYGSTLEEWLRAGKEDTDNLRKILGAAGFAFQPGMRILEFGCATGRLLRWLLDLAPTCEIWGVDITEDSILWCQRHLSPPFRFVTTTTMPHLPFEDRTFDLIYTGSVFTHIADLAEMWLLELRRILKPGGKLYVTVFDESFIEIMLKHPEVDPEWHQFITEFEEKHHYLASKFAMFTINRTPGIGAYGEAQTFYAIDHLRKRWAQFFNLLSVTPSAFVQSQTAVLLEK